MNINQNLDELLASIDERRVEESATTQYSLGAQRVGRRRSAA